MPRRRINIVPLLLLLLLSVVFASCGTYNMQVSDYYGHLRNGNYDKAAKALDNNKLLKKNRNYLLYLLERGKMSHLLHQWDSSNVYFNEADNIMEQSGKNSAKDIIVGTLMNPMMETYQAEDFEKYLVHYYKSLNYLQLGLPDEAMVEARRISLRAYTQEEKAGKNKYESDAFSFMLQGMIYEKSNDINNAFIAYRNAVDVYLAHDGDYYGTRIPEQLKKDLLRMAHKNGFVDELGRYEKLMNITYNDDAGAEGGELILFWENGSAPVKAQQDIWFTLNKGSNGFFFTDAGNNYNIPFDNSIGGSADMAKLEDIRSFRMALPKYQAQALFYSGATAQVNSVSYSLEAAENINTLAFTTLKERMLRELSASLTRLAVKKLAEAAIRPDDKENDNKKGKTEEQKKKDEKKKATREALAFGLQVFNFASEKADTRNWQSLPHTIYYTRIPLQKGENKISLQLNGKSSPVIDLTVNGTGNLQFHNICTLNPHP